MTNKIDHKHAITDAIEVLALAELMAERSLELEIYQEARMALEALRDAVPEYYEYFSDAAYYDKFAIRKKGETRFGHAIHVNTIEEARDVCDGLNKAKLLHEACEVRDDTSE